MVDIVACKPPGGLQPYLGSAAWLGKDLEDDEDHDEDNKDEDDEYYDEDDDAD